MRIPVRQYFFTYRSDGEKEIYDLIKTQELVDDMIGASLIPEERYSKILDLLDYLRYTPKIDLKDPHWRNIPSLDEDDDEKTIYNWLHDHATRY